MTPFPSFATSSKARSSCAPQSQRAEWKTSPVRHDEWTRTSNSSFSSISPITSATCSSPVMSLLYACTRKSPYGVGKRGEAGGDAAARLDRNRECRPVVRGVVLDHQRQFELVAPLLGHRKADQSATVAGHEVDRLRRHFLRGNAEVTLVLAIFVIDD